MAGLLLTASGNETASAQAALGIIHYHTGTGAEVSTGAGAPIVHLHPVPGKVCCVVAGIHAMVVAASALNPW